MSVVVVASAREVPAMACANHSCKVISSQKIFGKLMVFRHLNMDFTIFFNIILNLSKLSLSFKTKTCEVKKM